MEFIIEKGIPLIKRKGNYKYPFREMEIGDSFIASNNYSRELMSRISNAARNWVHSKYAKGCEERKYAVRKVDGNKIRVWRIK